MGVGRVFLRYLNLTGWPKGLSASRRRGDAKTIVDYGMGLLNCIDMFNEAAENITRFATYMTSRQMGRSIIESIDNAKHVTVNFNQRGAGGSVANNWFEKIVFEAAGWTRPIYLFVNAAIQGLHNIAKATVAHPGRMLTVFASYMLSGFIAPVFGRLDWW